ncbi:hypothetical protein JTE90_028854 [Oedothorax gibbosus]|uniref:Uncharacterized protein n=1 Tax=Oedothorax gibbosus TaxID=931172 RepID=A0AAV6VX87_9ARAC|nr:hypothetical protein JTE90_028854 [Oedothorax gibbosus]
MKSFQRYHSPTPSSRNAQVEDVTNHCIWEVADVSEVSHTQSSSGPNHLSSVDRQSDIMAQRTRSPFDKGAS